MKSLFCYCSADHNLSHYKLNYFQTSLYIYVWRLAIFAGSVRLSATIIKMAYFSTYEIQNVLSSM